MSTDIYANWSDPLVNIFSSLYPSNGRIYHYCSLDVFAQIVRSKELWLTDFERMNDYSECKWTNELIHEWRIKNSSEIKNETFNAIIDMYNINICKVKYLVCFSRENDLLSQWRAYSNNGKGIAIGFDITNIKAKRAFPTWHIDLRFNIGLLPVVYGGSFSRNIIDALLKQSKKIYTHGELTEKSTYSAIHLVNLSTIIKNPAFSEEKEMRLILTPFCHPQKKYEIAEFGIGQSRYRVMSDHICSYYPLRFEEMGMPITEIVIGPKNTSRPEDIFNFLHEHDIKSIQLENITRSSATYR